MTKLIKRRHFIHKGTQACFACAVLLTCPKLFSQDRQDDELTDLSELCYCGYKCPDDCKMLKGSLENNADLLKEAYVEWDIKNRYGVDFDPEVVFCYTCKNPEKPGGVILSGCTVRKCAIERELECCIECNELSTCEKDLWKRYPEFHKIVIQKQKDYQEA